MKIRMRMRMRMRMRKMRDLDEDDVDDDEVEDGLRVKMSMRMRMSCSSPDSRASNRKAQGLMSRVIQIYDAVGKKVLGLRLRLPCLLLADLNYCELT